MRWVVRLGALVVAGTLFFMLAASARHIDLRDSNDARGPLDVARVQVKRGSPPSWRITTHPRWKVKPLWDRGFLLVFVDSVGGDRADYYVLVRAERNKLKAILYRDRLNKRDYKIRTVKADHPAKDVITVGVPLGAMRRRTSGAYAWYVESLLTGDRCRRVCFDRAPDSGTIAEPGSAVPTPTVTAPTPTPTASP